MMAPIGDCHGCSYIFITFSILGWNLYWSLKNMVLFQLQALLTVFYECKYRSTIVTPPGCIFTSKPFLVTFSPV